MRLLHPAVGLCVLGLVLTGCGSDRPAPAETLLSMPASPAPTTGASAVPPAVTAAPDAAAPGDVQQTDAGDPAIPSEPSAHCVIVAGGVTTAMLAPLSLRSDTDHGELVVLRQQILDLRGRVPADLRDDFTSLAEAVEAPPEGSGKFDERSFRDAMVPVEDWLGQHCGSS